jgi:hypothetical protein
VSACLGVNHFLSDFLLFVDDNARYCLECNILYETKENSKVICLRTPVSSTLPCDFLANENLMITQGPHILAKTL